MESSAPNLAESSSSVTTVHGDSSPDAADVTRLYLAAAAAAATNAIDLDDLRVALASVRDDILSNEDYDLDAPLHREDVPRFLEKVGSVKCMNKALLLSVVLDILPRSRRTTDVCVLAESSRDFRHVGDLTWHTYYQMSELAETSLPPMRYTCCQDFKAKRCFHRPCPMLQIFGIKLKSYLADSTSPLKVYGFIAVRDAEDYRRNYLFNRSWDYPLTVNLASDFLRLMSPKRGMSMQFDCLIEVDIRAMSVTNDSEDKTLVDGCKELIEGRISMDKLFNRTMSREHGSATFDLIVFQNSVEATIQLIFSEVPLNGMDVQMCGYTAVGKNFYSFIGEQCECDSFITSDGRLPQYFIAAVQMGDTLFVDFMEGKLSIPFEAAIHGSEEKLYHFQNGAGVSVKASWSTTYY
ncbi:hypothetical protein C2845_PM09G15270 [Panicum miliaceum]|uniref:DUF6598 domain-containing protein n=1 Tax=Panicum miliaceum TaxID=4540 RepID=A0A3L6S274_PANMI|nr:hypothetical protein C2845_PM09G15270 [Panicum miliaceum]